MNGSTEPSVVLDEQTDYTKGEPRPHHRFYFPDGSFVFQVEKAIFKASRSLLSSHSSILQDMFKVPQGEGNEDGTDKRPVVLAGDNVKGWEVFLGLLYPLNPLEPMDIYSGSTLDSFFPIVHKYSMGAIEKSIIQHLEISSEVHDAASLMMISQILDSNELYDNAKKRLIERAEDLKQEDAVRIGASAVYEVMRGRGSSNVNSLVNSAVCGSCGKVTISCGVPGAVSPRLLIRNLFLNSVFFSMCVKLNKT
ncbi:hypothetical protein CPB86DRAFT_729648 [Serendipita vermifera]|nr:hypothetical protein CPB86DRAFT_729648 [Serendipita vermifera]